MWEEWTDWSECTASCGGGQQIRSRNKQVEKYGGDPCEGLAQEVKPCNTHFCPSELAQFVACVKRLLPIFCLQLTGSGQSGLTGQTAPLRVVMV